MAYTFDEPAAAPRRTTQYFEMLGNRAIYHDGWVACTTPPIAPWDPEQRRRRPDHRLPLGAVQRRQRLQPGRGPRRDRPGEAQGPADPFLRGGRQVQRAADRQQPHRANGSGDPAEPDARRKSFTFFEGMSRIPEGASPDMKNKSFSITAVIAVTEGNASGMILTQGGLFGGYGLYLEKGKPVFHYNFVDVARYEIAGSDPLAPGKHTVRVDFAYDGGGMGKGGTAALSVDGNAVANGRIEHTIPVRVSLDESLDVGEDAGTPLNLSYDVPFRFTGTIEKVTIDLK